MADLSPTADHLRPGGHFVSLGSSRVHYTCWGTGPRVLFAFHGYGESGASFDFLAGALGGAFTVVAIDLPFHGATVWREGLFLAPADLLAVMDTIAAGLAGKEDGWWLMG
jgi:pimeloyl-ACP methyl ester carboxylesterase